jgi:CBS domain-containing protein
MNTAQPRTAGDIMRRSLVAVRPDQKLAEAERLLVDHHISGMPVIEGQKLVGMLSRSDLTRARVLAEALDGQIRHELHWDETQADGFRGREPERFEGVAQCCGNVRVRDVMRSQVVICDIATPIAKVAELLVQHHIHRIIVVEAEKPVGIISSLDLVRLLAGD